METGVLREISEKAPKGRPHRNNSVRKNVCVGVNSSLSTGDQLGEYEILGPLGSGGMGEVYRAKDPRLGRDVAIKVLPGWLSNDEDVIRRFEREARLLASISHPNILTIHDFDTSSEMSFTVTELLEGETLRDRLRRTVLSWDAAVEISALIADGLSAAHNKGIVHRDLKPENIFLTSDGRVKILDFGLARIERNSWSKTIGEHSGITAAETKAGLVMGTVGYMSPEQIRGYSIDQRADIFSLGCVLYEMLTGNNPFRRNTAPETMAAILKDQPQEPSKTGKIVPVEVDHVIMHCLSKNPEERFHSAHDLSFALKEILRGSSSKISSVYPKPRRKTLPAFFVVVLLSLIAATFFRLKPEIVPDQQIPVAVTDFINETQEKELDGLSGMLITSLEQSPGLSVMTRSRMFDYARQAGRNVEKIDEELGKDISKRANVNALIVATIRKFGKLYTIDLKVIEPGKNEYLFAAKEEGDGKESIPSMIDRLSQMTQKALNENVQNNRAVPEAPVAAVTTRNLQAYQHYFDGDQLIYELDFKKAEEKFSDAIKLDSNFGLAYYRLAYAIAWSDEERAKPPLTRAMALIEKCPEKEGLLIRALNAQAGGRLEEALQYSMQTLKKYPQEKEAVFAVGDLAFHMGDYTTAETYFQQVLQLDPSFPRALQHMVLTYRAIEDYDRMVLMAKEYLQRAPSEESYEFLATAYNQKEEFRMALDVYKNSTLTSPYVRKRAEIEYNIFTDDIARATRLVQQWESNVDKPEEKRALYFVKSLLHLYKGEYQKAAALQLKIAALGQELESKMIVAHSHLERAGIFAIGLHDPHGAREAISNALAVGVSDNLFYLYLFDLYLEMGDINAASRIVDKLFLYPHTKTVLQAHVLRRDGQLNEAISRMEVAAGALMPNLGYMRHLTLARWYIEAGQTEKALQRIEKLESLFVHYHRLRSLVQPKFKYFRAQVMEAKGDHDSARRYYRDFVGNWSKADPNIPELLAARNQLQ